MKNKKILIIPIVVLLAVGIYCLVQYLNPKIWLNGFKDNYELSDFSKGDYNLKSTIFINKKKTTWELNGYPLYEGEKPDYLPVIVGKNTLKLKNNKAEKTYEFNINYDDLYEKDLALSSDNLDYDKDGIPNVIEKELGLSTSSNDTDSDGLYDNVELIMGLDPLKKDDYNEIRTFKISQDNDENKYNYLEVKGKGNIGNSFIDKADIPAGIPSDYIVSDVVKITTSNNEKTEEIKVSFLEKFSWKETSIYSYDENTKKINKENTTCKDRYCSATIDDFNKYLFVASNKLVSNSQYKNQIHVLIDNSGSMYSKEYVESKTKLKVNENNSKYGNDIEFKRLSLMEKIVSGLGTNDYSYSISGFTGDYCELLKDSKDIDTIKTKINSLKTNCQNFNGTRLNDTIWDEANKFDNESYGHKYIIILTDGKNEELFAKDEIMRNYILEKIDKKGIKVITIGLGHDINSENLINIASKTNGKYLYSPNDKSLEMLIDQIKNTIENDKSTLDGKDAVVIADSEFDVKKDGFNFKNFGSKDSEGGNCYGFASLSKEIYLNVLKDSDKFVKGTTENYNLMEYTLTSKNKERLIKGNIYLINLNDDYKKALYIKDTDFKDEREIKNNISYLKEDIKKKYTDLGFTPEIVEYKILPTENSNEYTKYETIGKIDLSNEKVSDNNKDDYQLLQLINRKYREQSVGLKNIIKTLDDYNKSKKQSSTYNYDKEVDKVINEVKSGTPALISLRGSIGGHTVLANKVYKMNNEETYVVGIYDSNNPGVEGKAYFRRQAPYKKGDKGEYYSFEYENAGLKFTTFVYSSQN